MDFAREMCDCVGGSGLSANPYEGFFPREKQVEKGEPNRQKICLKTYLSPG